MAGTVLYYQGAAEATGFEPWRSDGTEAGTVLLKDLDAGPYGTNPTHFVSGAGATYFLAGGALWRTDGAADSTTRVAAVGSAYGLTALGSQLYFFVLENGVSVWRSDGTAPGTQRVREGFSPLGGTAPLGFAAGSNGRVVFAADDGVRGFEPWASDGTPGGTVLLRDISPGGGSSRITRMASGSGRTYFTASSPGLRPQLWRTDGTPGGTTQLTSLSGGVREDRNLVVSGVWVYFVGSDEEHGEELWRSDGTPEGTRRITDVCPGPCTSSVGEIAVLGETVYFTASDGVTGVEVWRTDGTAGGTRLLKDATPGPDGWARQLAVAGGRLFFVARDDVNGEELWMSDGTTPGTTLRGDLTPGPAGTSIEWMLGTPRGLFFTTLPMQPGGGRQLWFDDVFTPCAPGDADADGIPDCGEVVEGLDPITKDNDVFTNARLFAMQQYRDFLGREGESGGVTFWSDQLTSGARTRAQMVEAFFNSPEFQALGAPMVRLYFAYFLRIPDYGGLAYWTGRFRAGESLQDISNSFAGSPEFAARSGDLDNAGFVDRVYRNVLGRAPDSGGLAYWKSRLDGGMTRGQMMVEFSESAEYRSLITNEVYVTMLYVGMLRRAPDSGGFSWWVDYLDAGNSGPSLVQRFIDAPEYRNRFLP